jgi:serine/threonine protein kinase
LAIYDDITGTLLGGRYRVNKHLGEGAFGKVFLATHEVFGTARSAGVEFRKVALKLFSDAFVNRDNAAEAFREAILIEELGSSARHRGEQPGLVTVYDLGTFRDYYNVAFIAMELVEGGSLDKKIRLGLPLTDMVKYARQICAALKLAHQADVFHRDLKPENVLFTSSGFLKLSDFGIAIDRFEAFHQSGAAGTIGYAPPGNNGPVTAAFDVYSMGVIMVEFLLGHNVLQTALRGAGPDRGGREKALLDAQHALAELRHPESGDPLANSLVQLREDRGMQEILRQCLQIDQKDRYSDAIALDDALQRWQSGRVIPPRSRLAARLAARVDEPLELLQLARQHRKWGELEKARECLAKASAIDKRDSRVSEELARLHEAAEEWAEAEAAIRRAMDCSRETPERLEQQARYLDHLGKTRAAMAVRERASRLRKR